MKKKYSRKTGARFSKKAAQIIGEEIGRIQARRGKLFGAKDVVDAARDKKSPLHKLFEWNNTKAAELYRLSQARTLIVNVTFICDASPELGPLRAFVNVNQQPRTFTDTETAMADPKHREFILAGIVSRLKALRAQYQGFKELAAVFAAIDKL